MDGSQPLLSHLKALYAPGLFRQAWDNLTTQFGPPRQWQTAEVTVLGARLLNQLGLGRSGDAVLLHAWRRWSADPETSYYYLRYLLARRGPLALRARLGDLDEAHFAGSHRHADWLSLKALMHACYRDWHTAYSLIEKARQIEPENRWTLIEHAQILMREDRYSEALALVEPLALDETPYRPALQSTADLYQTLGDEARAIELLAPHVATTESLSMLMQQHSFLLSAQRPAEAAQCLQRARAVIPEGIGTPDWRLRLAEYEQAYLAGDYGGAIQALQEQRLHFFARVRHNLQNNATDAPRARLPVPFIRQHHMTCAPATFVAVARYWGHNFDHLDVADQICYDGTPASTERRWMSELGWTVREFELSQPIAIALIDRGVPVNLSTVEPGNAHMQALIGYDLYKGVYLLRDPSFADVRELLIDGAHDAYASTGPRAMVCVPPEEAYRLDGLALPAEALYDHYYALQLALEKFDRPQAVACLDALQKEDPDHRLTLWARRSIASFDMDTATQLEITEQLLARYPGDLNLIASRAWALGALGRDEDKRQYLRDAVSSGVQHPFLLQALADALCDDERFEKETRQLLHRILAHHPTSGQGLYTLAGLEWDKGRHAEACELYRLASLVEPANERLAESYFRATRWIHAGDTGLDYLRQRADTLGTKSANASVTLALALQSLSRHNEAHDVMRAALLQHPANDWLIKEAVDLHVSGGRFDEADQLLATSGHHMSQLERLRKQGEVARARGDQDKAAECWQAMLALQPGHHSATHALAWLTQSRDGTDAALALVDTSLQSNPHDYSLRGLQVQLLEQWPAWQRLEPLTQLADRFPNDSRVLMAAGRATLVCRQPETAQRYADQVLAMDPRHGPARLLKGDACVQRGDMRGAADHFRDAIRQNVDTEDAFYRLVESCAGFTQRQQALRFIHAELLRQVTFGNALLDFADIAPRYLPDAEVRTLLEQAVGKRPDLWQSWSAMADFQSLHGEEQPALNTLGLALQRYPMTPRLWVQRGRLQLVLGNLADAEADLRQALQISPGWTFAITSLADILEAGQRHDEALAVIEQALQRTPDASVLHGYHASLLRRLGRHAETIAALRTALEHDPDYDWAWEQLSEVTRDAPEHEQPFAVAQRMAEHFRHSAALWRRCYLLTSDIEQELTFVERAQALRPHDPQLLIDRCNALLRMGRVSDVHTTLRNAQWPHGKPSLVRGFEAWLQSHLGHQDEAIKLMQATLEHDPGYLLGWELLADWHRLAGNRDASLRCARRWLELSPRNPAALVQLAEQCLGQDNADEALHQEAQRYLERALTLDSDSEYILLTLLDSYLDNKKLDDARALLDSRSAHQQGPFVLARRLRLATLENATEDALGLFEQILATPDSNRWVVRSSIQWLTDADCAQAVTDMIHRQASHQPGAAVGTALADHWQRTQLPQGKLYKQLKQLYRKSPAACHAALETTLVDDTLTSNAKLALVSKLRAKIIDNVDLRRQVTWLFANLRDWKAVIRWNRGWWREENSYMDMLYLYNFALRLDGHWKLAEQVTHAAENRRADNVVDNVRLWRALDLLLRNNVEQGHYRLARTRRDELAPLERYAFDVLNQVVTMRDIPLSQNVPRYQRAFAGIRQEFGGLMWEKPALALRKRLRQVVLATLPASPWLRLWWWWRLKFLV